MHILTQLRKSVSARAAFALLSMSVACGDSASDADDRDAGSEEDASQVDEIETFNGCAAKDYVDMSGASDSRVIEIGASGLNFSPKCMTIAAGQSVTWQGSLSAHPLAAGNPSDAQAGSADSPIVATSTGQSVKFKFDAPGTYPYYCTVHAFGAGQGMAGSVHVRD